MQSSPAATTHFIHDRFGNVIAETKGGGATGATGTVREYVYLPETEIAPTFGSRTVVDRPLAVVDAVNTTPVTYWVSADHLNRPVKMTNAAKTSVWDAVWQPWGGVQSVTGTATLNTRFPGQWFQSETGLHYNWHRSYDPTLGRYTQPDPLGFVDGPSVYGYAKGSPQRFSDFAGLMGDVIPFPKPPIPLPIPKKDPLTKYLVKKVIKWFCPPPKDPCEIEAAELEEWKARFISNYIIEDDLGKFTLRKDQLPSINAVIADHNAHCPADLVAPLEVF